LHKKWKPLNGQAMDYFMKTPKTFGSIVKIKIFSMDLEALILMIEKGKAIQINKGII